MSANVEVIEVSGRMAGPRKIDTATTKTGRDDFGLSHTGGQAPADKVRADLVVIA
jgi:hypothetical protein